MAMRKHQHTGRTETWWEREDCVNRKVLLFSNWWQRDNSYLLQLHRLKDIMHIKTLCHRAQTGQILTVIMNVNLEIMDAIRKCPGSTGESLLLKITVFNFLIPMIMHI